MVSPESRSVTGLKVSFSATENDEEETEKHDRSHGASDNTSCPPSIVLTIGIGTAIGAATTSGSNSRAGRLALLGKRVSRIEGMRDLAGTGSNDVISTGCKCLG